MFKKIFTLLIVLSWCFTISAQDYMDVSPNLGPVTHSTQIQEAMWDLLLGFDVTALSGAAGNAGAEWDGTYLYSTRWASNLIHKYDATGTTLVEEFSISGVSGLRDLAFDGTYMYGGAAANTIYQMDFATKTLIGTIPSPVAVRFIAYDAASDAFWCGTWGDPMTLVSRTGQNLGTIATTYTSKYGAAYDDVSAGGPYLWIFDQGTGAGAPQMVYQYNIATGTPTGVSHDVTLQFPTAAGIAGGLFAMSDYQSGTVTLGGLLQGTPDNMFVYDIGPAPNPTGFFDNFDSYTAGVQLCTQTTEWEPWGGVPGAADDPYVSSAYAYSGANTVLIVQNNDLVRQHGNLTSGKWYMSFLFYIPTGKSGYFNTMNQFERSTQTFVWGMDSYFDAGGTGRVDTTGGGGATYIVPFTWTQNAWNQVVVIVDLDTHTAEYWIGTSPANFTQITTWDWTQNGTKPNQLAVNDIFGAAATDEMYVDNYYMGDAMPPIIPVELTSFTAVGNNGVVELNWQTATEVNNHMFEIERKSANTEYRTIGYVEGAGTTTEIQNYSYTDKTVEMGSYTYRLKQIDYNGTYTYSPEVEVDVTAPLSFNLEQNYPNPFNPSTKINYSVPEAGNVKLAVYNIVGEEVAVLVNGYTEAGHFNVSFDASNLPSGVYLYKLQSDNAVQTKKMMLLK